MARYAGSQGKGPKKTKRDQLKASVHVDKPKGHRITDRRVVHEINDGDNGIYYQGIRKGTSDKAKRPNLIRKHVKSGEMSSSQARKKVDRKYNK
jgi:hypothetical protein